METDLPSCKYIEITNFRVEQCLTNEKSGPIVFLGGLLLLITSILEFILGNTFPCVVFGTIGELFITCRTDLIGFSLLTHPSIGGFWFAFAATMIPAFNAAGRFPQTRSCSKENAHIYAAPYSASATDTVSGLSNPEFMNTFGKFVYRCAQR